MRSLYLVAAVTMAGVSSVFALMAELEHRYQLPTSSLGWIAGSAFVAALMTQLSLSRYADRGHAATLLRAGVIVSAVGLIWFGLGTVLWQFVAARALLGAGVGMIIPPARRAIIVTSGQNQGEGLGMFYAAYLTGFVFGPPLAGLITVLVDVRVPFIVLGAAVALSFLSVVRLEIPEADPNTVRSVTERRVNRRLLVDRRVIAALLVIVSFRYSIGVVEPLWAIHLDNLGAPTMLITLSLTGFALPMLVVARRAGALSDTHGPRLTSLLSAAATVPLMAAYGYVGSVPLIMAMAVPHGLMEAVQSPGSQAALADAAPTDDAAAAQGLGEAAGSAAAGVGAFSAAPLFASLGPGPAWLIAGLVMTALLSVSAMLDRPRRRLPATELASIDG
ncbi:MAG: MFS transporter [Actinomycetia bacterium]|nr:MFS transporter [Actinomycetes bacterium]MCP5035571.1 MFS transporter [Actinomycetes bacterium]